MLTQTMKHFYGVVPWLLPNSTIKFIVQGFGSKSMWSFELDGEQAKLLKHCCLALEQAQPKK